MLSQGYLEVANLISLSSFCIRFNVQQRQDPLFTFVDFNQLNWPREGTALYDNSFVNVAVVATSPPNRQSNLL
jgi:hypothetical protein